MDAHPQPDDRPPQPRPEEGTDDALSAAAHDLRNALAVVGGRAPLLARHLRATDDVAPARVLAGLAEVERASKAMAARLARLEDDQAPPQAPGRPRWPPTPAEPFGRDGGGDEERGR